MNARRLGIAALIVAALSIVAVVIIHTPPVRALILRYAIRTVERDYGIRLDASQLDYNLATLRIALHALRVGVPGQRPFFEADRVDVALASSVWRGVVAFENVAAT